MAKPRKKKVSHHPSRPRGPRLPLVSVIIPCFNQQAWVRECVDSVLKQTYPNVEIIVVDDGSTDGTPQILKSFGKKIHLIRQERLSANSARNAGWRKAKGKYVQFLDADDYLMPRKFQNQVARLEQTGADLCLSFWRQRYPQGNRPEFEPVETDYPHEDFLCWLLRGCWFAPVAALWRMSALDKVGPWDESFPTAQDTDFNYRAGAAGLKVVAEASLGGVYRKHANSSVSADPRRARFLIQAVLKLIPILEKEHRLGDYAEDIASRLRTLSKGTLRTEPELFQMANHQADELSLTAPPLAPVSYQLLFRILGMRSAEHLATLKRALFRRLGK